MSHEINLVVMNNNEIIYDKNSNMRKILTKDADYILLRETVKKKDYRKKSNIALANLYDFGT